MYTMEDGNEAGRIVIYEDWAFMFVAEAIEYNQENIETILKHIQ